MRCAVIGDPAAHSLSPVIHRRGYELSGLDWQYEAITVKPEDLDRFIAGIRQDPAWAGLSVTAPHKEALLSHGEPDEVARLVGAGNTLVLGEAPRVHNTDVPGFVRAWRAHGRGTARSATIVGNGATARSILVALAGLGVVTVTVLARRPERAHDLRALGIALGIDTTIQPLDARVPEVDLLASTIPAAATDAHARNWAQVADVLFDAVYDPWPTPLGEAGRNAGRLVINGLDLLAGQAVDQFHLLTGRQISFEECRGSAGREMQRRSSS